MTQSTLAYMGSIFSTLISIVLPIVVVIYLKNHYKLSFKPVIIGVLTWLIATQILENILHIAVFTMTYIKNYPWIYVGYGISAAALFEETGRYIAFSYLLKQHRTKKDGIGFVPLLSMLHFH